MIAHDLALALVRYEEIYSSFKPKMTITQFIVMGAIQEGKTHAQAKIAERTGLSQPIVRVVCHKLYARKFIKRTITTGFKAGRPIAFTEAGIKAYEECQAMIKRADAQFFHMRLVTVSSKQDFVSLLAAVTT